MEGFQHCRHLQLCPHSAHYTPVSTNWTAAAHMLATLHLIWYNVMLYLVHQCSNSCIYWFKGFGFCSCSWDCVYFYWIIHNLLFPWGKIVFVFDPGSLPLLTLTVSASAQCWLTLHFNTNTVFRSISREAEKDILLLVFPPSQGVLIYICSHKLTIPNL